MKKVTVQIDLDDLCEIQQRASFWESGRKERDELLVKNVELRERNKALEEELMNLRSQPKEQSSTL